MHKHTPVTQVSTPLCHMPPAVQRYQVLTRPAVLHALVLTTQCTLGRVQSSARTEDEKTLCNSQGPTAPSNVPAAANAGGQAMPVVVVWCPCSQAPAAAC